MVIAEKFNIYGIKLSTVTEDEVTLTKLVQENPVERGDALAKRAILHLQAGRYNAAFEDLETCMSDKPDKLYEESNYLFALLNYLKNDMKTAL